MTGQLIQNGIEAFTPATSRITEITGEILPYILYIAIACLSISIIIKALKSLLGFTDNKAKNSIGGRQNYTLKQRYHYYKMKRKYKRIRQQNKERYKHNYYDYKQHDYDQNHGKLKPEREYRKKR